MHVFVVSLFIFTQWASARIHNLHTLNDTRKNIALSKFGFYEGGILDVSLKQFRSVPFRESDVFGFSLDKTLKYVLNPYVYHHPDKCILENPRNSKAFGNSIYFVMDLKNKTLKVIKNKMETVRIFKDRKDLRANTPTTSIPSLSNSKLNGYVSHRRRRSSSSGTIGVIPMVVEKEYISTQFVVYISSEASQGLYNLYFHNCPNYEVDGLVKIDLMVEIEELNKNNYLSADEMPLSALYFMISLIFCLSGSFWIYILAKSKHPVYKIHYLMAVLVYLKCLSLLCHGINFHYIQTTGKHVENWAILFYIIYLLEGSVFFTVILLIGSGCNFIRRDDVLSNKRKIIFMILLSSQVLANVAKIIIDVSEEGDVERQTWWYIFIVVDVFCFPAIVFTLVCTIRHLRQASHTDGKTAINLRKLKLIWHFYIMIVCYFYFTRIIVDMLMIGVPFQYGWLDEMLTETATFVCFILTGYKFRPASDNPYNEVPSEEDEIEIRVVVSDENLAEGLKKANRAEPSDRTNSEKTNRCL